MNKGLEETRIVEVERKLNNVIGHEGHNYQIGHLELLQLDKDHLGTRDSFIVNWGPCSSKRVVKVDRPLGFIENPRARRHVQRGCDTSNELDHIAKIDHPGTTKLVDYFDAETTKKYGLHGVITVEEFVPESRSLEEVIEKENKGYSFKPFSEFALQSARTISDINQGKGVEDGQGIFHRDLKPSNFLIRQTGSGIEVKITDWANATRIDSLKSGYMPTMGGHLVSDPLLMGVFTGKEKSIYNNGSEIYALVATLAYVARGKPIFDYDPDIGEARAIDDWEDLLTDGKLDKTKHQKVLQRAVKSLPKKIKKRFGNIFMKGLTLNPKNRYETSQELFEDIKIAAQKTSRLKKLGLAGVVVSTFLGLVGTLGYFNYNRGNLEQEVSTQKEKTEYEEKSRLIQLHLQGKRLREEKGYYTYAHDDFIEQGELKGWLDKFRPYDYDKKTYVGDEATAIAAYFNADSVYEVILKVNPNFKPEDLKDIPSASKRGLKIDYETLEPILMDTDPGLYSKMFFVYRGSCQDNVSRIMWQENHNDVDKRWIESGEKYLSGQRTKEQTERLEREPTFFEMMVR